MIVLKDELPLQSLIPGRDKYYYKPDGIYPKYNVNLIYTCNEKSIILYRYVYNHRLYNN